MRYSTRYDCFAILINSFAISILGFVKVYEWLNSSISSVQIFR